MNECMYFIAFYSPPEHTDSIKEAMFKAGAGKIGNYTCCAWQTSGRGQYMPLPAANPFAGKSETLEQVQEDRVEMVCDSQYIDAAITALRKTHPYETPAFQVIRLE